MHDRLSSSPAATAPHPAPIRLRDALSRASGTFAQDLAGLAALVVTLVVALNVAPFA